MTTQYTIELCMEKSIQRITQPICVRINENETQLIRAKLTYENSPYSVQCDSAELHLLRDDGTWSHMEASVSGSSVTCTIKANQLGKHAQNACAYFFFKKGTQTETTESFQMRVERAAVDTEASDAFFDTTMNAIATKWGAYEATAEAQESARQSAESKRVTAEQERVSAEQSRVQAEQSRVQAEQSRQSAENERKQAEQSRAQAEQTRTTAEQQRVQDESNRANAEQARVQAEQSRAQAENKRQSNESTRTSAEQSRQSRFNEMLDAAQNVKFRILSSNEIDSEGKPTITGIAGVIYLVKAPHMQETNHYTEWIYLENRWEVFGSTAPTAEAIELDDIDKLEQGTTIAGNRVLNATGLNTIWSKLQARIQSVDSIASEAKRTSTSNASSLQALTSKQSTFEEQASKQLKALRTWAESTLETKMQERYNAGFSQGQQRGGEICERALLDCNVNDFMRITERKSTSEISALIKKLSQYTKSSLLWNNPDRMISLVLPTYTQDFFKNNWEHKGSDSLWFARLYIKMKTVRARELSDKYAPISIPAVTKKAVLKRDAFYTHFDKSKIAEIAGNPSILLSLPKDDFMNACYAYACDGTKAITLTASYSEICEKRGYKWLNATYYSHAYGWGYRIENARDSEDYDVDSRTNRAYVIDEFYEEILGDTLHFDYPNANLDIRPNKDSEHRTSNSGVYRDAMCTITLRPIYKG